MAKRIKIEVKLSRLEANALARFLDQVTWQIIHAANDTDDWRDALAAALNRLQVRLTGEEIDLSDRSL
jgi:hypothetical protein